MITIGITGGIGSGKSTASQILGELGAEVIDADKVGHRIYLPDTPAWREIVATFGEGVLAPDRTSTAASLARLCLAILRRCISSTPSRTARSSRTFRGRLITCTRKATRAVVVEAAIFLEAGWRSLVDQLWVVVTDIDVAIARLKAYKNFTEDQARARIAAQLSNEERMAQADKVLWNNTDLAALRQAVEAAWHSLS